MALCDTVGMFLWNTNTYLSEYTVLQPRRPQNEYSPRWKPKFTYGMKHDVGYEDF
jgi:hypothetical protein